MPRARNDFEGISTSQLAVTIWILARATLLFAKAYQIVKETNHKG